PTSFSRDWSSDVCSSDLGGAVGQSSRGLESNLCPLYSRDAPFTEPVPIRRDESIPRGRRFPARAVRCAQLRCASVRALSSTSPADRKSVVVGMQVYAARR